MTSIWQTQGWNKMLKRTGQIEKIILNNGTYIQKRKIGLGMHGLFIIGVPSSYSLKQSDAVKFCKIEGCLFLQIEYIHYNGIKSTQTNDFKIGHFKKFITPFTALIELTKTEEEILAQMKPKGRYNIRLAEKKGVKVDIVEKSDQNIKSFYELSQETTQRDAFSGHSFEYYKKFLMLLPSSELILAQKDGEFIAGGIFIFEKDVSIYYYGASSSDPRYRNLMAPYAVQWTAIQYAKKAGSNLYDFLGVSGTGIHEDIALKGVTDFKMKLTPQQVHVSQSLIYIQHKILFLLIITIKKIKSHVR